MKLKQLRKQIDVIDEEIMNLLSKRLAVSRDIAVEKRRSNLPISDPKREKDILKRIEKRAIKLSISRKFALDLFGKIISLSKKEQK